MLKPLRIAAALAAVTLAGCATAARYEGVAEGSPSAELVFEKGYKSTFFVSARVDYSLSTPPECTPRHTAGLVWATGNSKKVRAPVGQRIMITAVTAYIWTTPSGYQTYTMNQSTCTNQASFTPQFGRSYKVVQEAVSLDAPCRLHVVDAATGKEPSDLQFQSLARCGGTPAKPEGGDLIAALG